MENFSIRHLIDEHVEKRALRLLEIAEEIKDEKAFDRLWTPKGMRYFVKARWPEALEYICGVAGDRDKSVLEKGLARAVSCLYLDEVVVLLNHGASLTKPTHDKHFVLYNLFVLCNVSRDIDYRYRRLAILKIFVALDEEGYVATLHERLHTVNVEEIELVHYLVSIGVNIFVPDIYGSTLYGRCEKRLGRRFTRCLRVRWQFVNSLLSTMLYRIDLASEVASTLKCPRIK